MIVFFPRLPAIEWQIKPPQLERVFNFHCPNLVSKPCGHYITQADGLLPLTTSSLLSRRLSLSALMPTSMRTLRLSTLTSMRRLHPTFWNLPTVCTEKPLPSSCRWVFIIWVILAIWLETGTDRLHLQEFLDGTEKYYQADLKAVDFIGAPEECRGEINGWVEQQTESTNSPHWTKFFPNVSSFQFQHVLCAHLLSDKIKDLLKPGTVSAMTRLALVNAIYFKGNWKNRFDEANTKEMPFKVNQVRHLHFLSQGFPWWTWAVWSKHRGMMAGPLWRTLCSSSLLFDCNSDSKPASFPTRCTR